MKKNHDILGGVDGYIVSDSISKSIENLSTFADLSKSKISKLIRSKESNLTMSKRTDLANTKNSDFAKANSFRIDFFYFQKQKNLHISIKSLN